MVVLFISGAVSLFVSKALFASPDDRKTEVEVVEPIAADFTPPDPRYFNAESIDPTQLIQLGGPGNPQPL